MMNLPPILTHVPKPENMTAKEKEIFWRKEQEKWLYGIDYQGMGIGIPGSMYFFGQWQFIKHRQVSIGLSAIQRPLVRDVDFILHHEANYCIRNGKSLLIFKGTGVGLSTFGGSFAQYTSIAYPGSNSFITSHSTNTLSNVFQDKIIEPMMYIDEDILERIETGNKAGQLKTILLNKSKQKCFLKINVKNFADSSESVSSIDARETSEREDSPYNFAGGGANYAYVDEFAIHKRKVEVQKALTSRMRDPNTREIKGLILLGGALEVNTKEKKDLDSKDIKELQDMIKPENLEANSMRTLFLPFWYGYNCDKNNGHSDKEEAMRWWDANAERFDKSEDKSLLRNFKMTNPRTIEDIFENIPSNRFEEEVQEKIILWHKDVVSKEVPLQECNIVLTDKYHFTKGDSHHILEHPKQGVEYIVTCDGVQTSEVTSDTPESERSKIAMVVTKLHDPATFPYMPVCTFAEHPKSVERSIYRMIETIKFYNQFGGVKKINTEINVGFGEFFGAILDREGLGHLCAKKRDFSVNGFKETSKRFYYRDDLVKARQYNLANSFLKRHMTSVQMINLLEEMLLPISENTDVLDAWLGIFETIPEIGFDKPIKKKVMPPRQQYRMTNTNGKIGFELVTIGATDRIRELINQATQVKN